MDACEVCGHREGDPLPPGKIIQRRRRQLGLRQEELLAKAGSDRYPSWLARLETHRRTAPQMTEFAPLCRVLGIDAAAAAAGRLVLVS